MARTRPFARRAAMSLGAAAVGMTVTSLVSQHQLPSVAEAAAFLVVGLLSVAVIAPVARRRVRAGRSDRL